MTNERLNNDKQRIFGSWKAPPNITLQKWDKVLFITKMMCCLSRECTRLQVSALERRPMFARLQIVRSSAHNRSIIPRSRHECDEVRATGWRGVRSIPGLALECSCTRSWLYALACRHARSCLLGSSALAGTPNLHFKSFSPFNSHIDVNDLQHSKTLKLTKTLKINNAKSLTNIS